MVILQPKNYMSIKKISYLSFILFFLSFILSAYFFKNSEYLYITISHPASEVNINEILKAPPFGERRKKDIFELKNYRVAMIDETIKLYLGDDIKKNNEFIDTIIKEINLSYLNRKNIITEKLNINNKYFFEEINKVKNEKFFKLKLDELFDLNFKIKMLDKEIKIILSKKKNNYFKYKFLITLLVFYISLNLILLLLKPQISFFNRKN